MLKKCKEYEAIFRRQYPYFFFAQPPDLLLDSFGVVLPERALVEE
jgi:hypothetical protein